MEITIIHGQGHKGSTYNITKILKEKFQTVIQSFTNTFLQKMA